jgi:SAM-dependent methyltransferase
MASILNDIARNCVAGTPVLRRAYLRRRSRRGYNPATSDASYPRSVFAEHRAAIEAFRPIEGRVLEIGPGGNIAVGALFAQAGAESVTCIDVVPWARDHDSLLRQLGVTGADLARVSYECPVAIESASFAHEAFDIIYSNASFEHFEDPRTAVANIARMLSVGGVTSHAIDFRDHRDFERPLEFLYYGDRIWNLATSNRLLQTNRWRASDVLSAFERSGLRVLSAEPVETTEVLPEEAARYAKRFREKSLDDLGILTFRIVATRD